MSDDEKPVTRREAIDSAARQLRSAENEVDSDIHAAAERRHIAGAWLDLAATMGPDAQ